MLLLKREKSRLVSVYLEKVGEIEAQGFFNKLIDKLIKGDSQKEPTAA